MGEFIIRFVPARAPTGWLRNEPPASFTSSRPVSVS